jgi:hypothetical protein
MLPTDRQKVVFERIEEVDDQTHKIDSIGYI